MYLLLLLLPTDSLDSQKTQTKTPNQNYRDNYDTIFKKKETNKNTN